MRGWPLILLATGCNSVFGLDATIAIDAQVFDAPADAPFACPPIGSIPVYSPLLHQVIAQKCFQYSTRAGHAVASCQLGPSMGFQICEGPEDQPLAPAPGIPLPQQQQIDEPRLSSDAQELLVRRYDYNTSTQEVLLFERGPDGTWTPGPTPPFGNMPDDSISTIARGPTGDRVLVRSLTENALHEWAHEGVTWRHVRSHAGSDLGGRLMLAVNQTGDGLRAVIYALPDLATYYMDRPDVSASFGVASPLIGAPPYNPDPVITDDCARLYATGIHSVFYAQPQ